MTAFRRTPPTAGGRRTAAVATAAAAVLATGVALAVAPASADASIGSASADAATGWTSTATHALSLVHATNLGSARAATPLRLTIGLTPRNRAAMNALIRKQATRGSGEYGKYLTPAQFSARFAATPATARTVSRYLTRQGMTHVTVSSNRLLITADATVGRAEKAFDTSISRVLVGKKSVLANTRAALVPSALKGMVSSVLGLSTIAVSVPTPVAPNLSGFYPKTFQKVYDAGSTRAGAGTSMAIIAEGNLAPTISDLRYAERAQGLPATPVSLQYAGIRSTDTSGADEWNLDTQTSTALATNVKDLYIYVATSLTDSDLARAINLFVSQDKARAGSASLGECDLLAQADGSTTVDDMAFAEAATQGQTFFASSGDTGSSCAVTDTNGVPGSGPTDTEYPASSPYVTGVGGTTLDATSAGVYGTEIAWNAGGGGISPIETSPYWQQPVLPTTAVGKGVPDVAFDADPDTGANIYVNKVAETIGGTSLASPLALGMWTRILSTDGNALGFAPPKLYGLYTAAQNGSPLPPSSVPGFHDITVGTNGLYDALPGYDYTTGLGSWDVSALAKALK